MKYVIIGTGAAGITAADEIRKLEKDAELLMVSVDSQVHSRCMLHKYLSHERTEEELDFTEENFFEKKRITVVNGNVVSVNTEAKTVLLESGEQIA